MKNLILLHRNIRPGIGFYPVRGVFRLVSAVNSVEIQRSVKSGVKMVNIFLTCNTLFVGFFPVSAPATNYFSAEAALSRSRQSCKATFQGRTSSPKLS